MASFEMPSDPISSLQIIEYTGCRSSTQHPNASISSHSGKECKINTLKNSLEYFCMPELLKDLEQSLEDVRRKKRDKRDHHQLLRDDVKKLLKKSKIFHPDKTINRGESEEIVSNAQNVQSALNATIAILKTLTELFLEDTDIYYKYEYFEDLEINILASENEINQQITNVLYKISTFSEITRMSIVGRIRKFLLQSQDCVESYFKGDKDKFMRQFRSALYHLKKCIDGYESLDSEYSLLEKECSDEGEENMISVIQKLALKSSGESRYLRKLEKFARKSLYDFKIFGIEDDMDEYFVLPFVHHMNALLMCRVMLKGTSVSWRSYLPSFPSFRIFPMSSPNQMPPLETEPSNYSACPNRIEKIHPNYREAYNLVCSYTTKWHDIATKQLKKDEFDKSLTGIVTFLKEKFKIDVYNEGKSNKAKIAEELLLLKEEIGNIKEKIGNIQEETKCHEKNFKTENEQILEQWDMEVEKSNKEPESENQKTSKDYSKNCRQNSHSKIV